ncbi:Clp1/GlmU family protein [Caldisphaera sp.]|uniref:Clp1/GlmU family protein n=1 Tax=Caldisphaera sp. TaxID=2060322 RepID=UPI0025C08529|nr:Clp1/GlmU family protein [Caldisphaera sp.]
MSCNTYNGYYLLQGPLRLNLIEGSINILGFVLNNKSQRKSIIVPLGRSLPIIASKSCIEVSPSYKSIIEVNDNIYTILYEIYRKVSNSEKILIIGPNDSGKSTLAAFLINSFWSEGKKMKIMSADLGQNEIYCPSFVSISDIIPPYIPGWKDSVKNIKSCFVGDFSSYKNKEKYIECIEKLGKENLIIDTDGLVDEESIKLKLSLAQKLNIDTIISIGIDNMAEKYLDKKVNIINLDKVVKKEKSRMQRKENRDRLISNCILKSSKILLKLNNLKVINEKNLSPGYIAGIESSDGNQYFGIIYKVSNDILTIITQYVGEINKIEIGYIKLNLKNYENLLKSK